MKANYLIVYETQSITGSYFTNLSVSDKTTTADWVKFNKEVKEYLIEQGAMRKYEDVVLLNIVKLNETE